MFAGAARAAMTIGLKIVTVIYSPLVLQGHLIQMMETVFIVIGVASLVVGQGLQTAFLAPQEPI